MLTFIGMVLALPIVAQTPGSDSLPLRGARSPVYTVDARMALMVDGDLWAQRVGGAANAWIRVTAGRAWDRDPAWTPDGSALYFSSDRSGRFAIWRVRVGRAGESFEPERVTNATESEASPTVGRDGTIVFVRGRGASARLWVRASDGAERRLTAGTLPETAPVFSPDGTRLAYIQDAESGPRLRVRPLGAGDDRIVISDRGPERIAWSPAGDRLAWSATGGRGGVYVTPVDGHYVNLVSEHRGDPAWSPDGRTIAIAERSDEAPGYNGDPDRLGDRVSEQLAATDRLIVVDAPAAPDAGIAERSASVSSNRAARNAEAFDRAWDRTATLYYAGSDAVERRAQFESLKSRFRPRALAAPSDAELEATIHAMLRERPALRVSATGRAAVSSAHPVATAAGLDILQRGGNVVDAAVAVSFALGVVEPDASGMGGYGQMLVQIAGMERPRLIEFMTRVPEDAGLGNATLLENGRYPSDGPVLANVPGTVAGMHRAWKLWGSGKVTWKEILAPAIRAARDGYVVSDGLATTLATEREAFSKYPSSRALFFRDGEPLHAGDTLRNPDLAWTLEQVASGEAGAFYTGEIARRMVSDLRGKGNAMRLTDLARYFAAEREPVTGTYRGYTVFSSAPPVNGGATLIAQLNLLEQFPAPRPYPDDAATFNAMLDAWVLVPSGRGRIADPGLWPVSTDAYTSKDSARARWRCYDANKALPARTARADQQLCDADRRASAGTPDNTQREGCNPADHANEIARCRSMGTTSFAVADGDGNAVAVTQTLGTWGGNFYVTPGLGFLYNDKLTSYATDPNGYGARLPFARHGSSITPTLVFKGTGRDRKPVLAVGAAGNEWITSAVYQTIVGVLDFGMGPQQALELPRFHVGTRTTGDRATYVIAAEDGFAPDVTRKLQEMGWEFRFISLRGELRMGYGAAITLDGKKVTAGADPRRAGAAGALP